MKRNTGLAKLLTKEHERKWVAFSRDYKRIVNFDASLVALKKSVGDTSVVYMKIPPSDVYLSF